MEGSLIARVSRTRLGFNEDWKRGYIYPPRARARELPTAVPMFHYGRYSAPRESSGRRRAGVFLRIALADDHQPMEISATSHTSACYFGPLPFSRRMKQTGHIYWSVSRRGSDRRGRHGSERSTIYLAEVLAWSSSLCYTLWRAVAKALSVLLVVVLFDAGAVRRRAGAPAWKAGRSRIGPV